jgi:hypothetical protein
MTALQLIGYWRPDGDATSAYPHPSDWVDCGWDRDERSIVGGYLASGTLFRAYMGLSPCRICGRPNGAAEYTDGTYVWPEGLAHYVDEHAVRLPAEVVAHAMSHLESLEDATVSDAWWLEQPMIRGESVSSAASDDPELPPAPNDGGAEPTVHHEAGDGGPDGDYLDAGSVWLEMAQLLIADGDHKILSATARGTIAAGQAEVAWTELHRMTADGYRALVSRAREVVAERNT